MRRLDNAQRQRTYAFGGLSHGNPFLLEPLDYQRLILVEAFVPMGAAWHKHLRMKRGRDFFHGELELLKPKALVMFGANPDKFITGRAGKS